MAEPAQRAATYEDLLAVPENMVAEILFGSLVTHPRPGPRHSIASSALGNVLGPPFQFGSGGPSGWIFMDEPELHLGGQRRDRIVAQAVIVALDELDREVTAHGDLRRLICVEGRERHAEQHISGKDGDEQDVEGAGER